MLAVETCTGAVPWHAYRSDKLAVFALGDPFLSESLSLTELGYGLVSNGRLQLWDGQAIHGFPQSLKDSSLVASMSGNLFGLGFENGFLAVNCLVGDHRARAQTVECGLDILGGQRGEGFRRQNWALLRQGLEDLQGKIPGGCDARSRHYVCPSIGWAVGVPWLAKLFLSVKSESLAHKVSPTDKLALEVLNIPPLWRGPFYGSELMLIPQGHSKQRCASR